VHLHGLTDSVLSLDLREFTTANCEVFCYHGEIIVPTFEVAYFLRLERLKCERSNVTGQLVLCKDFCGLVNGILLVIDGSDYHALQDIICLSSMSVWRLILGDSIITIVEFCYVASKILNYCKLTAWMDPFIAAGT